MARACTNCNFSSNTHEFGKAKKSPDGLKSECRACSRLRCSKWYADNREEQKSIKNRKYAAKALANRKPEPTDKEKDVIAQVRLEKTRARRRRAAKVFRERHPEKAKAAVVANLIKNREKINAKIAEWRIANREKVRVKNANRAAAQKGAAGRHSKEDVDQIFKMQGGKCAICAVLLKGRRHVDHIQPIALNGSNDRRNLQILCVPCNLSKGCKDPLIYMRECGRLI